jgi:hypothetical protein
LCADRDGALKYDIFGFFMRLISVWFSARKTRSGRSLLILVLAFKGVGIVKESENVS